MIIIDTITQFYTLREMQTTPHSMQSTKGVVTVPCLTTMLVNRNLVIANTYNPNAVSKDKMKLLMQSILDNGFCFPIVTIFDETDEQFVIIDGFHRYDVTGKKYLNISHVPIVVLDHDITKRMAATVQFNKARGVHQVDLDADVIRALIQQGMSEENVSLHLGIDMETIHRYKQLTGIAELFKNAHYSTSWYMKDGDV